MRNLELASHLSFLVHRRLLSYQFLLTFRRIHLWWTSVCTDTTNWRRVLAQITVASRKVATFSFLFEALVHT